ncbi:DNA-binding protein [Streptomyces sp. NPDC051000]|uniref:DNA-binding protein n=1 Tax=Streptomyces sp. NPDC051000 TaxID=3155520 RepID=UPI0033F77AB5
MNTETIDTDGAGALLDAGAVLPADTTGAGEGAVELTARAYRHPALGDDRVVIRLSAAELGAAEDLAAGFLGLVPDGDPAVVGLGRRQALGFPEWVLVHHPEDGHHALAVVPELDRAARQAKTKPKAALDACLELAGRLAASVPHFLPVFHEQAARIFLAVENTTYAAQLFGKARASEAEFGLIVDEDRLDAVFLEFALAGALPVKVLTGYGKALALRVSPTEAFDRFRRLCVRRTAGGLPPSAQVAVELRRLARAAGLTGTEPEQDYLAELLPLPATLRAAVGWWKAHRAALLALARRVPAVRGTLLGLTPPGGGDAGAMAATWLELLTDSGATAGLSSADVPAEERCSDGASGWLERFQTARYSGWGTPPALPGLLELVERAADRLRAELAAPERETGLRLGFEDVDLLDLVLSLDLPLADPDPEDNRTLGLQAWGENPARRELRALCADQRMRPVLFRSLNELGSRATGRGAVCALAKSPGSSGLLAEWVREVAASSTAAALPALPAAIRWLTWLPAEALALAPEDVARAAALDVGGILARTLRGGLFEELTWPAWEAAVAELRPNDKGHRRGRELTVMDAWPHLIVANSTQVRVIDADSTVLTHDLRIPRGDHYRHGYHYVDGDLLVFWVSYGGAVEGYWLSAPNDVLTLDHPGSYWSIRNEQVTLPLPGGGRFTGHGVLHAGDTRLPTERAVLSDGTSYWVWDSGSEPGAAGWHEYDPASASVGRRSQPAFLADALRGHPEGSGLPQHAGVSWLRPTPTVEGSVLGAPVDGLLGWRAVHLPDRGWHGSDTGGRSVTVPAGGRVPQAALSLPGDDRPRVLSSDWRVLILSDHEGVDTSRAASDHDNPAYSTSCVDLPPLPYWYCLRARDVEGSAALRTADAETCGALLKAAGAVADRGELPALVSAALPRITSPELIGGVVDKLRDALRQRAALDRVAAALNPAPAREPAPQVVRGPSDRLVAEALEGLVAGGHRRFGGDHDAAYRFLRELASVAADTDAPEVPGRLHFDVPGLTRTTLPWTELFLDGAAAVAYRAVVTGSTEARRAALCAVLDEVVALGLDSAEASAGRWRRVRVHLGRTHTTQPDGRDRGKWRSAVLPLGGGALLAITGEHGDSSDEGREFTALLHDPAGRFAVPEPYTSRGGNAPLGDRGRGAGWLAAFLGAAAEHGAAPWFAEAAEEFARLTGVCGPAARLVLAGLPDIDTWDRNFLPAELRAAIGVKATDSAYARDDLRTLDVEVRRELVAALLPAEPARLWSEGPDVAAAAAVWNRRVGRRTPVPDWLLVEATRAVGDGTGHGNRWSVHDALPALLDPAVAPQLNTDVAWVVRENQITPREPATSPFTAPVLTRAIALTGWLAHRLPAGDPVRAVLPAALTAVRRRLAGPELLLGLGVHHSPEEFRKAAGTPTETGEGYERYGAVVLPGAGGRWSWPALRPALLDSTGGDPYLPALRGPGQQPFAVETALRLAHDPGFARLLADPGAPAAGSVDKDGTWWPQDAGRSVPDLVAQASDTYGLGPDAAVLYLALLAMPDPTDRNTARWTGWKLARMKAARAELGATDLVVTASRSRAGRSLFLPGGWADLSSPTLPVELWKLPLYGTAAGRNAVLGVLVPTDPAAELYRRAWERVREGDAPRFEELKVKRTTRRRR